MTKRSNGRLRFIILKMRYVKKLISNYVYFFPRYIYYKYIYLNPAFGFKLFFFYRLIILLLTVYTLSINNLEFVYNYIDIFLSCYNNELDTSFVLTGRLNSLDQGSSNSGSFNNSGPSYPGNGPGKDPTGKNYTGTDPRFEIEKSNKRDRSEVNTGENTQTKKVKIYSRAPPKGPGFYFFDKDSNNVIYPESYLNKDPVFLRSNSVRIYDESSLRLTFYCEGEDRSKYYCKILFPDGTHVKIYDKPTVFKFIQYHRDHIKLGYSMKPVYHYDDYYKKHFDVFRKNKVNSLIEQFKEYNAGRDITNKSK